MAQAAEQGGDHVLVAEEVEPVIVVEVGRDAGPLSAPFGTCQKSQSPNRDSEHPPNLLPLACRAVLDAPRPTGLSTSARLQCRTTCAVVKGKSREDLVDVDRTRAPRGPRATARWSTSREHTPGVFHERLSRVSGDVIQSLGVVCFSGLTNPIRLLQCRDFPGASRHQGKGAA
jgi:hypothetical protein